MKTCIIIIILAFYVLATDDNNTTNTPPKHKSVSNKTLHKPNKINMNQKKLNNITNETNQRTEKELDKSTLNEIIQDKNLTNSQLNLNITKNQ